MTTMNRNKKAIDRIVQRLSREWQKDAGSAISRLYDLLDSGKRTSEAISVVRSEYPKLFTLTNIRPALVEAAAYGYGIVPSVLTSTQKNAWSEALAKPWDAGGLTLSKKLHGADVKMREAIADTVRDQMRRNAVWTEASLALYDGYGRGNVVRTQELPKYLSAVRYATKGSPKALRSARIAIANIERLARKGSPTKALKASYQQLIDAAENGTAEELEKACRVAIEEKSRYVAQRIIRTETARAYADGFVAKMDADDDVVAVRLRLSTRHPVFDICDFFADADMYGLGKGVYPKDKAPPIPLHPHCMCRLEEVFSWELDISKAKNQVKKAGNGWLEGLTDRERREVLGIAGDKAWKEGESWQKYLRNWKGLAKPETRLADVVSSGAISGALNDKNDPTYERRDKHAEMYYEARRKNGMEVFVDKIHKNTKYPKSRLKRIYRHVFVNKYVLGSGYQRFIPDYEIARSVERLMSGKNIEAHDMIFLKHEHLEFALMKKKGYNYDKAHTLTETKYNYALAVRERNIKNGNH